MHETHARTPVPRRDDPTDRLAGAPISWGACEIPGWGVMPSPDRVLAEMAELGLHGTELGAAGFFPEDPASIVGASSSATGSSSSAGSSARSPRGRARRHDRAGAHGRPT